MTKFCLGVFCLFVFFPPEREKRAQAEGEREVQTGSMSRTMPDAGFNLMILRSELSLNQE